MLRILCITIVSGLALSADIHPRAAVQQQTPNQTEILNGQTIPVLPEFAAAGQSDDSAATAAAQADDSAATPNPAPHKTTVPKTTGGKEDSLKEDSRLDIMRNVSGEYARMVTSFPGGKKGFHIKAGEPLDQDALRKAIQGAGAVLNSGDTVQITRIEFRGQALIVELNGGGRGHTNWRDHVQMGIGGVGGPVTRTSTTTTPTEGTQVASPKNGATFYLEFGHDVPNLSSDDLKRYLSVVLDFSKQRSASVQWASTLPPKVQQAIAEKRPDVGMDRDEVLAAMGRPDRKVRERDPGGNDTEDWIYGQPPAKTIFVRFEGDKVIQIDKYPQ